MSRIRRLDDLWVLKILEDQSSSVSPISNQILVEQIFVQAMTAACAADKWASYSGKKLRHTSQRDRPESSAHFEAIIESDGSKTYKLQVFEVMVIV